MSTPHHDAPARAALGKQREQLSNRLESVENIFLLIVGVFIILLVIIALVAAVQTVIEPLFMTHNYVDATVRGVDAIFLAIILLELLHTTISRGPLIQQVQEFLMIGITAAVRHSLEVGAARDSGPRDVVINLAINAMAVLFLVLAMWLVRQRLLAETHSVSPETFGTGPDLLVPNGQKRGVVPISNARDADGT